MSLRRKVAAVLVAVVVALGAVYGLFSALDGSDGKTDSRRSSQATNSPSPSTPVGKVPAEEAEAAAKQSALKNQLTDLGYRMVEMNTNATGEIDQKWSKAGEPSVSLTNVNTPKADTFRIDIVMFSDGVRGYKSFWCIPPTVEYGYNAAFTINSAKETRQDFLDGDAKLDEDEAVLGSTSVETFSRCWMQ